MPTTATQRLLLGITLSGLALSGSPCVNAQTSATPWHDSWHDPSPKNTLFVEVEPGVKLEVLDWGGTGRPLVLLSGLGNTAHVFDSIAPKLAATYHVYGITRRGYGASSAPSSGYSADRLGDDVLAVLTSLKLAKPILMGHSIAGEELSSIGSRYPDRIAGLIYLDAAYYYAYRNPAWKDLAPEFGALEMRIPALANSPSGRAGMETFPGYQAWAKRVRGVTIPEADLHETLKINDGGLIAGVRVRRDVPQAILAGVQTYTSIKVPVLALCAVPHAYGADFGKSDPAALEKYMADETTLLREQADQFQSGVPSAHVVRLPNANHYVFLSNEDDVLRETNAFLTKLP